MPTVKQKKMLSTDDLRHSEYYEMQPVFDRLYAGSKNGGVFEDLMPMILSRENILLAYRNIKTNTGSNTAGTDKLTIKDIGQLTPDEVVEKVRYIVVGSKHGYRPKPVRRKDIPKPNGSTRPLGIPCIWDRLVQQCIKQIMEPICEAKFSNNSHGFRPNCSAEHAIAQASRLINLSHLYYVIEFDIKGFFDNVDHSKLVKQIWAMGIHDKHLIYVIKRILTADIKMPDNTLVTPNKGTPQGGIISPLLANIVLNELDHWVASQWQENPAVDHYAVRINSKGTQVKSNAFNSMRNTALKEIHMVRYADDFRIFCRTKTAAEKTKLAVTLWLKERLRLDISEEKTRVVNVKRRYSEFLGFKIKALRKGQKHVAMLHMSDKALKMSKAKLVEQAKAISKPKGDRTELMEIELYNSQVLGVQNYYRIATNIALDCAKINRAVMTILTNRLKNSKGNRLVRRGRELTNFEREQYGKSKMLRFVAGSNEPIYPIAFIKARKPLEKKASICSYTVEGRVAIHDNLRINVNLLHQLMRQPLGGRSVEYADNRISLFSAQWGKCAITGHEFQTTSEIHCHHKTPRYQKGADKYENLVLVLSSVHRLIHATDNDTISRYLKVLNLNGEQVNKLNNLRELTGLCNINV